MAPQKRKQPHDVPPPAPTTTMSETAPRRATRQAVAATAESSTEPERQRRSGRIRANTLEDPQHNITSLDTPEAKRNDASKSNSSSSNNNSRAGPAPPSKLTRRTATATATTTTTTRGQTAESETHARYEPEPGPSIVVKTDKKRATPSQPSTRQIAVPPPVTQTPSPTAPKTAKKVHVQANTSRPRSYVPQPRPPAQAYPQAPASSLIDPASASTITPKRRASAVAIAKTPGTPHTDRNIDKVVLGNICFKTWFPSYYSKEVLGEGSGNFGAKDHHGGAKMGGGKKEKEAMLDRLHVCPSCFKYSKELLSWTGHMRYCQSRAYVPGTKVYTHPKGSTLAKRHATKSEVPANDPEGEWSVWEVDGERDVLFCQNLSLFAKFFLDNKSVFFDVTGFTYFLLVYTPPPGPTGKGAAPSICGFFSKEKMSWDNNNLACILVFPPWQRKGLGALLMGVSYEISKREGVIGGPEKPISELGRRGYKRYWAGEIARWLLSVEPKDKSSSKNEELLVDIEDCSKATWIVQEDCLAILREMDLVEEAGMGPPKPKEPEEGEDQEMAEPEVVDVPRVRIDKEAVRRWVRDNRIDLERVCDPDGFVEGYAMKKDEVEEEE
ncbi:acyl-CoA N-acyltransferase [Truncatella angustata]|uniref:histone acetyltransferase n=1 Tax=Truncatella angustata TaxID=152316 RepID=A0A9P8ZW15_9PEZI|nr:acyl-CoA N-acyltransferase [Truncatella angustata]KAH6653160.1 acyl-CoA N-acyltransferase [Truncatella angustata]